MPISTPPPEVLAKMAAHADEQIRDVFNRMAELKAEAIAEKIRFLLNHADWRAIEAGIKLRAKIAGDFAPEVIAFRPDRAEDLGQMDEELAQIPTTILMAMIAKAKPKELGE